MPPTQQILGLRFFQGTAAEAAEHACANGGVIVAPSGTCFTRLQEDPIYRAAMLSADTVLPDSGFMVLLWRLIRREQTSRISGLAYFRALIPALARGERETTFWVLPNERAQTKLLSWARGQQIPVSAATSYIAPMYGVDAQDPELVRMIEQQRPDHIVVALSGGVQEKLGTYLRESLSYRPAIHCIGAALGFVTGDQKPIPEWADRLYAGWFLRLARNPRLYFRRFAVARHLPGLIKRYGSGLPPLRKVESRT